MSGLNNIYNFLPLTDKLLTSGQPTVEQFTAVASAQVKTVINLALDTSSNALPDEAKIVENLGMEYIHIPVVWEKPTKSDLEKLYSALEAQGDRKVLVHCAANMRVSAFIALYRIQRLGWSRKEAFKDTVRIWDPSTDPVWSDFIYSILGE